MIVVGFFRREIVLHVSSTVTFVRLRPGQDSTCDCRGLFGKCVKELLNGTGVLEYFRVGGKAGCTG